MASQIYGYVRVSGRDQNVSRQMAAMENAGVPKENIFTDKQSGKDFNRPMYKRMIKRVKADDVIYVKSIDRLGRNYEDILEQWKYITKEKRADIVVMDMPLLDTRRGKDLMGTFLTDIVLALLSYVAENERNNIRQRQAEGIAEAKANGVQFGRRPIDLPDEFERVCELWRRKELTTSEAAKECGMAKSTFYDKAKKWLERQSD